MAFDASPRPDPLHDPALLIFAYAAWALAWGFFGPLAGLGALVLATTALLIGGRRVPTRVVAPRFETDLAGMILCCCAAIGLGVLLVSALAHLLG